MEALDREIEAAAKEILKRDWTPSNNFLWEDRGTVGGSSAFTNRMEHMQLGIVILSPENRGDRDVLSDEVLQRRQLTLRDLHQQITAP